MKRRGSCGKPVVIEEELKGFGGVESLVKQHAKQIRMFKKWSKTDWSKFHSNCYDWWAFPIPERSSRGEKYRLSQSSIKQLRSNDTFMKNFHVGVRLLLNSYGWDLENDKMIPKKSRKRGMSYNKRPIRLYKCGLSCLVLRELGLYEKVKIFALYLESKKENLVCGWLDKNERIHMIKRWELYETFFGGKE